MNKIYWVFVSIAGLILYSNALYAQFSLSSEFRPRMEYRHGYKQPAPSAVDPAFFVSQRTRLTGEYKSNVAKMLFSFQDVRTWGDLPQLSSANDKLTLHQAWIELKVFKDINLKAGRQEIIYDDARLFGNVDWAQQGRSHDAMILKYSKNKFKADLGLAYNQSGEPLFGTTYTVTGNYKALQYLWLHQDFGQTGLSLIAVNNGIQYHNTSDSSYSTVYSQTAGGRATTTLGKLNLAFAGYYQTGKNAKNKDLDAFYLAAEGGFPVSKAFRISLGGEYLSGNSQLDASAKDKAFNPLYGTAHKFNGHMDYFYVGNHIGSVGLRDIYFDLRWKGGKAAAYLTTHFFAAAADVADVSQPGKALSSSLGTEFDFGLDFKVAPNLTASAGYSQMLPTETFITLRGGDKNQTHNWAWVMLVYKPDFIITN
ncbi:MAG: alginate export family protein [Bacteroidales bacterium]|nr:alginate export family protein [Bacteroidales bacterium]